MHVLALGTNAQLNGCVNDVRTIEALLKEFYGFSDEGITILVDAQERPGEGNPTGKDMTRNFTTTLHVSKRNLLTINE